MTLSALSYVLQRPFSHIEGRYLADERAREPRHRLPALYVATAHRAADDGFVSIHARINQGLANVVMIHEVTGVVTYQSYEYIHHADVMSSRQCSRCVAVE